MHIQGFKVLIERIAGIVGKDVQTKCVCRSRVILLNRGKPGRCSFVSFQNVVRKNVGFLVKNNSLSFRVYFVMRIPFVYLSI